jgi:NEDD8-activating enzyme E1 regulatory subunit
MCAFLGGHFSQFVSVVVKLLYTSVLSHMGLNGAPVSEGLITEVCQFGGAEIHPVATFIGGVASQ